MQGRGILMTLTDYRQQWFGNIRGDVLAGIVVALALIPEAIAFSIIAGVDPKVGLYASFSIAVLIAFVGGRPGMISAATAATAVLMITLVRDHGLEYLLAATVLAGLIQIGAGFLKLGRFMCQRRSKIRPLGGAKVGHFGVVRDGCAERRRPVNRAPQIAGG